MLRFNKKLTFRSHSGLDDCRVPTMPIACTVRLTPVSARHFSSLLIYQFLAILTNSALNNALNPVSFTFIVLSLKY